MKIRVKAKAVAGSHEFGVAGTGTEQIGLRVQVLEGEHEGQEFVWYGYFSEAAVEMTLQALKTSGWDGSDFVNLPGLGSTMFSLTLQDETNQQGENVLRATFINPLGVPMKEKMDDSAKAALAKRIAKLTGQPVPVARRSTTPF
jgi:hypothetical protein